MKQAFLPWLLCGTLALAAFAPGAGPSALAAAAEPTAPVRLEIRVQAGRVYRFRLTDDTVMRATVPGGGIRRIVTRLDGTFDMTVERANPDGSYAVRVRPVEQSTTVNDRDVPVSEASKAEATATLGRDGRISGLGGIPEDSEDGDESLNARDFLETLFDEEAGYPAKALGVGEGWKDLVESPLDEKGSRITVNSALVGLDLLQGRPVARLLNVVAEPVRSPADEDGVTMEGMLEGGGLTNVDLNTGLPVDGRDTIRLKMTVKAPSPDGTEMNVESEANIKVRVQALSVDAG